MVKPGKRISQVNEVSERLSINVSSPEVLTQLILDLSLYTSSEQVIYKLELYSRELIFNLHYKRLNLLMYCKGQQGLAVSNLNFPIRSQFQRPALSKFIKDGSPTSQRRESTTTTTWDVIHSPNAIRRLDLINFN